MKLRRKFEGLLSRGRGSQLLWLAVVLVALFLLSWGLSALLFKDGSFKWQDIAALILDPGVFGGVGRHDLFRLVLVVLGAFLFSAMLISVVSNIFENIAQSHVKGDARYRFKDHILILGSGKMLSGMLFRLLREDISGMDDEELAMRGKDIVIMTTTPVEALRDRLESSVGNSRKREFRRRVTFCHDDPDNISNLEEVHAGKAFAIYILGEDGSDGHDAANISCLKKLEMVCRSAERPIKCYVTIQSPTSTDIFHYVSSPIADAAVRSRLLVNIVNVDEYIAEQTLLGNNGKDQLPIDGKGFLEGGWDSLRFVVAGMTQMGRIMARTAAHLCHFKSTAKKTNYTVITFIDNDIREKMEEFTTAYPWLFRVSRFTFLTPGQVPEVHEADPEYGELTDIRWEFIEGSTTSPEVRRMLSCWASDPAVQLSVAVCLGSDDESVTAALHLPQELHRDNIPVYVHISGKNDLLKMAAETNQAGNLYSFGSGTESDKDPLLMRRIALGQKVNYVYSRLYGENANDSKVIWYNNKEANKFSSIYNANSIAVKLRAIEIPGVASWDSVKSETVYDLCRTEHFRWMTTELLMGFRPYTIKERKALVEKVREECAEAEAKGLSPATKEKVSETWKLISREKGKSFRHIDLAPLDELVDEEEKIKDINLLVNVPFIIGKTSEIFRYVSEENLFVKI